MSKSTTWTCLNEGLLCLRVSLQALNMTAAQRRTWLHLYGSRPCLGYTVAKLVKGDVVGYISVVQWPVTGSRDEGGHPAAVCFGSC